MSGASEREGGSLEGKPVPMKNPTLTSGSGWVATKPNRAKCVLQVVKFFVDCF
jgi:hypothetical protein